MYDPTLPKSLLKTQKWFADKITNPLSNTPLKEAAEWIKASHNLEPSERMEIYHEQYWGRLLKCLHSNFPSVTRICGYTLFNEKIAIPYLSSYAPSHWSLNRLGESLPEWIEFELNAFPLPKENILRCAQIDRACEKSSWIEGLTPLFFSSLPEETILDQKLTLQPHIHLFSLKARYFAFRDKLMQKDVGYWEENALPLLEEGDCYSVIYRNPSQFVSWKLLSKAAYLMLSFCSQGLTLREACVRMETEEEEVISEAFANMPFWFREWTLWNWFAIS